MRVTRTSGSEEYTRALGRGLAALLRPGDVVALRGDLGAGKTTLVRAVAEGLGVERGLVSSPTFVFINVYPTPAGRGPLAGGELVHVDAYRLTGADDLEALGWDRLFDAGTRGANGARAAVVEWPDRIASALPAEVAAVRIEAEGERTRVLTIDLPASWAEREGAEWFLEREPTVCPVTGAWVSPTSRTYPFADERARDADMYRWFTGGYKTTREAGPSDQVD